MSLLGESKGMLIARYQRTIHEDYFGNQASLASLSAEFIIKCMLPFLAVAGFKITQYFTSPLWPISC